MAGRFHQRRIDDDPVTFVTVSDRNQASVAAVKVVGVCIEFPGDGGIRQVSGIFPPYFHVRRAGNHIQRRRSAFIHFGNQRLDIRTRRRRNHLHVHAGLRGIAFRQLLQRTVYLCFKIQPVYPALAGSPATSRQAGCHQDQQGQQAYPVPSYLHVSYPSFSAIARAGLCLFRFLRSPESYCYDSTKSRGNPVRMTRMGKR